MAKAKAEPTATTTADADAALLAKQIDELGALDRELAIFASKLARQKLLRESIRKHFDNAPAAEAIEAHGTRYLVMLGHKAIEKTIDTAKLFRAIGAKRFIALVSVTQAALERGEVDLATRAQVISEARTGIRSLKTVERAIGERS